jgi:hypothetical protein
MGRRGPPELPNLVTDIIGGTMPTPKKDPGPISFNAVIQQEDSHDGGAWIVFPYDLKELYGVGNLVPVVATFDGVEYRGSIAKMGGKALLLVRKDVRELIRKQAGDSVDVTIAVDCQPREVTVPPDLAEALSADPRVRGQFESMSFSHRREYAQWVEEAKRPETRDRRISQAIEMIREGKRRV